MVCAFNASTWEVVFEASRVYKARLLKKRNEEKRSKKRAREMAQWVEHLLPRLTT